jgi:hypothetical protein
MDIILPNRTMKALLSSIPPNSMQAILHASPANRSVLGQLVAGELAGTMLMRDAVALSRTPMNTPPSYPTDGGRVRFSWIPREPGSAAHLPTDIQPRSVSANVRNNRLELLLQAEAIELTIVGA